MATLIIKTTDFVGFQGLAQSINTTPVLQAYIDLYEKRYLMWLLGETLGNLFIADLVNGVPQTQRFIDLFNSFDKQNTFDNWNFCWDYDCNYQNRKGMRHSDGIKQILLNCVFYHYVTDTDAQHTQSSVQQSQSDTSKNADAWRFGERRFNTGLDSWEDIRWFILINKTIYPEYVFTRMPTAKYSSIL
jgi:hypothetical protein